MNPEALPTFARLHACDFIAQTIFLDSPLAKRVSSSVEVLSCSGAGAMHSKSGTCDLEREALGSLLRKGREPSTRDFAGALVCRTSINS